MNPQSPVRVLDTAEYVTVLRELVESGMEASCVIAGGSMAPFLCDGRDVIVFSAPDENAKPLSRGDMVFYRRDDGRYIMHRIVRKEKDGTYTITGDAQNVLERGVRREQIFARVTKARSKWKWITQGNFWWEVIEHLWISPCVIPLRRPVLAVYGRVKKLLSAGTGNGKGGDVGS